MQQPDPGSLFHMEYDGLQRRYRLYLPAGGTYHGDLPLLIALHGGGGTGKRMVDLTRGAFNSLAEAEQFIVAYPDAYKRHWNDGRTGLPPKYRAHRQNIDDVGFISALIDTLVRTHRADPRRVYVTGMSNGALMSHRLAMELGHKIAAAAPVCGNIPVNLRVEPQVPVALILINGTEDPLVPYEGGHVHFLKRKLGEVLSTERSLDYWVRHNSVNPAPVEQWLADLDPADGCRVKSTRFGKPSDPGEVVLLDIEGGGHTWAGGWQYLNKRWIGRTCRDINACRVIWDFFKVHAR